MYFGSESEELLELRREYGKIFGYDPNGDVEIEIADHDEYVSLLKKCIEEKKDMFEILEIQPPVRNGRWYFSARGRKTTVRHLEN